RIQNSELKKQILLLGWRNDISDLLSISNIFFLPSREESFPQVILEAMALEKPVVATRVGGIPEIITSGENGIIVEPGNPKALAEAIIWMFENPGKAEEMGKKGKEKVEKYFTIAKMIKETEKIYEKLISYKSV
ncbi:MAG TPA: glycosyltransferase family 1 protein, partial [Elusimicrobia bacterium]|nr:glycosyltransferase family 1 protein [Elusimicrobiota bacterium]